MSKFVTVEELINTLNIELVYGREYANRRIYSSEVSRPGLILTGYKAYYPHERLQLLGRTEMSYINAQTKDERRTIYEILLTQETPALIFARDMRIPYEAIEVAEANQVPILRAKSKTSRVLANLTNYLESMLAKRLSKHGVFVEVFGMGVLLVGDSGVGKSETALELVQRGHRLIADDRVELYQIDELTLKGEAPEILQNLIEIRGLGIIDVMNLYGVASVRGTKTLELIIDLVVDDGTREYDRLGFEQEYEQIFEVNVPKITIPVKLGRNLAVIVESAAMNHRARQMGYDVQNQFNEKLDNLIARNSKEHAE
ncbi:HPr kinase/phosphorylase [Suicoccus acidiformans]|uniref:HPr kinase/phosphorylase n=1 Tax=Suicoccus acidiformans TaxID=2036206 RepID=A0A347WNA6_9LACT|nr:HPr(Ser) kinase/phosphatase [Suicoccus acidiformans]AXY26563.1 HPr kinase/phosphorylase [Suicoccus acidiformans]